MAWQAAAFLPPHPLSSLQVSLRLGHTDCLRELVPSDLGQRRCCGLLVPQQDPLEQRVPRRCSKDTDTLPHAANNPSCRGRLGTAREFSLPSEGTGEGHLRAVHIFLPEPLHCRQFTFNIICLHVFNTLLQVPQ